MTGRKWRWCGKDCVTKFFILSGDVGAMRAHLLKRDKGICAICGCDTILIKEISRAIPYEDRGFLFDKIGFGKVSGNRYDLWDVDHIVPHSMGGTHDPENLRTACIGCHKHVTKKFAHSRSRAGMIAQENLFND